MDMGKVGMTQTHCRVITTSSVYERGSGGATLIDLSLGLIVDGRLLRISLFKALVANSS